MNNLSFIERASIGIKKVLEQYPSAVLLEIDAWKTEGTTLNPDELDMMRVVFSFEDSKSITIKSVTGDTFEEPILYDQPFIEDMPIKLPIAMDLPEALELIQEAGLEVPFNTVTLRHPVAPDFEQPLYIVGIGGSYVSVNTVTKEVEKIQTMLGQQWVRITICAVGLDISADLDVEHGTDPTGKQTYIYPEGDCKNQGNWVNEGAQMRGAEGTLTLNDKSNNKKICVIRYASPYASQNAFYIDGGVTSGYDVLITGSGNTGHTGCLGACSLNVTKIHH